MTLLSKENEKKIINHAQRLGVDPSTILPTKIRCFMNCETREQWEIIWYGNKKKEELIDLCYKRVEGFSKSMEKKTKNDLIHLLIPSAEMFVSKYNWKSFHKEELVTLFQKWVPDYDKKLPLKKNDMIKLLEKYDISPPLNTRYLKQLNPQELLILCREKKGFEMETHGKTKKSMIVFLENNNDGFHSNPSSPVHIENLLDEKENVEEIRAAILHILLNTDPFKADPLLESKIQKIV